MSKEERNKKEKLVRIKLKSYFDQKDNGYECLQFNDFELSEKKEFTNHLKQSSIQSIKSYGEVLEREAFEVFQKEQKIWEKLSPEEKLVKLIEEHPIVYSSMEQSIRKTVRSIASEGLDLKSSRWLSENLMQWKESDSSSRERWYKIVDTALHLARVKDAQEHRDALTGNKVEDKSVSTASAKQTPQTTLSVQDIKNAKSDLIK